MHTIRVITIYSNVIASVTLFLYSGICGITQMTLILAFISIVDLPSMQNVLSETKKVKHCIMKQRTDIKQLPSVILLHTLHCTQTKSPKPANVHIHTLSGEPCVGQSAKGLFSKLCFLEWNHA